MKRASDRTGLSLLEVLMAAVVLTLAILGVLGAMGVSGSLGLHSRQNEAATRLLEDRIAAYRALNIGNGDLIEAILDAGGSDPQTSFTAADGYAVYTPADADLRPDGAYAGLPAGRVEVRVRILSELEYQSTFGVDLDGDGNADDVDLDGDGNFNEAGITVYDPAGSSDPNDYQVMPLQLIVRWTSDPNRPPLELTTTTIVYPTDTTG